MKDTPEEAAARRKKGTIERLERKKQGVVDINSDRCLAVRLSVLYVDRSPEIYIRSLSSPCFIKDGCVLFLTDAPLLARYSIAPHRNNYPFTGRKRSSRLRLAPQRTATRWPPNSARNSGQGHRASSFPRRHGGRSSRSSKRQDVRTRAWASPKSRTRPP